MTVVIDLIARFLGLKIANGKAAVERWTMKSSIQPHASSS